MCLVRRQLFATGKKLKVPHDERRENFERDICQPPAKATSRAQAEGHHGACRLIEDIAIKCSFLRYRAVCRRSDQPPLWPEVSHTAVFRPGTDPRLGLETLRCSQRIVDRESWFKEPGPVDRHEDLGPLWYVAAEDLRVHGSLPYKSGHGLRQPEHFLYQGVEIWHRGTKNLALIWPALLGSGFVERSEQLTSNLFLRVRVVC